MDSYYFLHVAPTSGVPIYRQIMDQISTLVGSGRLASGRRLPSVRIVAEQLQINPMTVSKAYSLLEREGILKHERGRGMRVASRQPRGSLKQRRAEFIPLLEQVVAKAYQLGLSPSEVRKALEPLLEVLELEDQKK